MTRQEKERIIKRYTKEVLGHIRVKNYETAKRIIDNIKELEQKNEL